MRIYTKSGDRCETGLMGGRRVKKYDRRIEAIGNLDELNATLGVLCTPSKIKNQKLKIKIKEKNVKNILMQIQQDIFCIGAELADPKHSLKTNSISVTQVMMIEQYIDALEAKLPRLMRFILPGGTPFAAYAHLARAVCRRTERAVVELHENEPINPQIIIYLNRLSDLLFMLARLDVFEHRKKEAIWK